MRDAERFKLQAPLERWRKVRDRIHETICARGFDPSRDAFTQSFGSGELDASLLLMPIVGFLPSDDPRVRGTVAAIERELMVDGLVLRYRTKTGVDGLLRERASFFRAAFGLPTITSSRTATPKPSHCSSDFFRFAMMSACSQNNMIHRRGGWVGNFPQAFLILRS